MSEEERSEKRYKQARKIFEWLMKNSPASPHNITEGTGVPIRTVHYNLLILKAIRAIRQQGDGRYVWIGWKKKEILPEHREKHTKTLQERVIKPWREQFPWTWKDGVYIGDIQSRIQFTAKTMLSVEDEPLFEDLRKHNHIDKNIFEPWNKFRRASEEYNSKAKNLKEKIGKEIQTKIRSLVKISPVLEISDRREGNSISSDFLDYIYEVGITLGEGVHVLFSAIKSLILR